MRLVCPNCDAQYEVADSAIPASGRDVQCSNCGHAWFQMPPLAEEDQAEEAALFGDAIAADPEPAAADFAPAPAVGPAHDTPVPDAAFPDAGEDDDPADEGTDGAEDAPPAGVPAGALSRGLDESLMAVLREEAEREMQARRADEARPLETQPELGIEEAAAATSRTPTERRLAMLKGQDPDEPPPAPAKAPARRDLLPDVEEINSTLRPSAGGMDEDKAVDRLPDLTRPRGGFRSGLVLMLLLTAVLLVVYAAAPRLAEQFPALAGGLTTFVAVADGLRDWLDGVMEAATVALGGSRS